VARKTIPNLTPVVTISPTAQLEITQAGTTYRTTAGAIAGLNALKLVNNVIPNEEWYPLFINVTNTTLNPNQPVYTANDQYLYNPAESRLTSRRVEASQGLFLNANTLTLDYTIPTGDNAMSMGPVSASAVITVLTGSVWGVI
jgi:hypothetical protein